jgi:hypothetical protein
LGNKWAKQKNLKELESFSVISLTNGFQNGKSALNKSLKLVVSQYNESKIEVKLENSKN